MTVSTYRVHAENTAQALNNRIRNDVIPADGAAVDQLLHSNEELVDALRHRGCDVGEESCYRPPDHLSTRTPKATLAGLDEKLTTLVDNIAFAPCTLPLDERRSLADFLAPAPTDPTVKAWRAAAIELLARRAPSRGKPRLSAAIHPTEQRTTAGRSRRSFCVRAAADSGSRCSVPEQAGGQPGLLEDRPPLRGMRV